MQKRKERSPKARAFAQLADHAEFALSRGRLVEALALFDRAVAAAPDAGRCRSLEVRRLRCLFAFGHWGELQQKLDELGARDDLPDGLRAEVLLHRGDVGLCELAPDRQEAARDLIRQALGVPNGLPKADADYARGLLTDSTTEAVQHFEDAVREDQFHLLRQQRPPRWNWC